MKIVAIGDSITNGLGVRAEDNWVSLLNEKTNHQWINKGINGDTTGGMLSRFGSEVIAEKPQRVVIIGGGNDSIMGAPIEVIKANISAMVHQAYHKGIIPIIGFQVEAIVSDLPNNWSSYTDFSQVNKKLELLNAWGKVFSKVFNTYYIDIPGCFSEKIGGLWNFNTYCLDGLHLNSKGHQVMADILAEYMEKSL